MRFLVNWGWALETSAESNTCGSRFWASWRTKTLTFSLSRRLGWSQETSSRFRNTTPLGLTDSRVVEGSGGGGGVHSANDQPLLRRPVCLQCTVSDSSIFIWYFAPQAGISRLATIRGSSQAMFWLLYPKTSSVIGDEEPFREIILWRSNFLWHRLQAGHAWFRSEYRSCLERPYVHTIATVIQI